VPTALSPQEQAQYDADLRAMVQATRSPGSIAFDAFQAAGHWDVPGDSFRNAYKRFGHDETLRLCSHPDRPYAGVIVWHQPLDRLDAWERFIAKHGKAGSPA
jgi:hypothetical protein